MSRYLVNKFIRLVNTSPEALEGYLADPGAFLSEWQRAQALQLTAEERAALATRDYEGLYAMGAHPFILWSFTQAVYEREVPVEDLRADYKRRTAAIGYPDFRT